MKMKFTAIFMMICTLALMSCNEHNDLNSEPPKAYQFELIVKKTNTPIKTTEVIGEVQVWYTEENKQVQSYTLEGPLQYTQEGFPNLLCEYQTFDKQTPKIVTFKIKCPALFGDSELHIVDSYWIHKNQYTKTCDQVLVDNISCKLTTEKGITSALYIP